MTARVLFLTSVLFAFGCGTKPAPQPIAQQQPAQQQQEPAQAQPQPVQQPQPGSALPPSDAQTNLPQASQPAPGAPATAPAASAPVPATSPGVSPETTAETQPAPPPEQPAAPVDTRPSPVAATRSHRVSQTRVVAATIPRGTIIRVRMDSTVDTKRNRAGDRFYASLYTPVVIGNEMVLPRGTRFFGHVTESKPSGRLHGRAVLGLELDSFRHGGRA